MGPIMKILLFVLIAYLLPLVAGADEETCQLTLPASLPDQ